ncbi:MAG: molybdopterin oxidoreductase family protein [Actinomycetia bacterium]|nr:molybdopterin oxidoreductase family protein [Actinomycetes bacterium]
MASDSAQRGSPTASTPHHASTATGTPGPSSAASTRYITCVICEASCGLKVTLDAAGQITDLRGHEQDPLSRGHICPKAFALQDVHEDPDRLKRPVRKVDGEWVEVSWHEAIGLVAQRLHAIQAEHGMDAVGAYLGNPNVHSLGAITHGLQLVRALRSRNVFSATSVDQLPHQVVAWMLYGHQFLLPVPDIDRTDLLVLIGHNPMASNGSIWTVPDFPQRRRDLAARGGRLIVIDPRRTETAKVADEHYFIRPGADAYALLAILRHLLARAHAEGSRAAAYVDGLDEVRTAVEPFTPEIAERLSGLPTYAVTTIADQLWESPRAAVHGRMGLSTQESGVVGQWAVQLINIVTGNLDREGGTMLSSPFIDSIARNHVSPGKLGHRRSRVRGLPAFGGELPVSALREEIETPGEGQIRGLLTIAGNPVSSTPAGHRLSEALEGLEFMVAIDFYINETTRHADVILPPTAPLERDHYDLIFHLLAVRNTARFTEALYPKSQEQRHDWEIARDLVKELKGLRGERMSILERGRLMLSPRQQVDALLKTGKPRTSVKKLLKTPGGVDGGPHVSRLPDRLWTEGKRINAATPQVIEHIRSLASDLGTRAAAAPRDGELLLIGRRHQRDNNSWLHNSPRLTKGQPRHQLFIHPEDAESAGITDGSQARVTSRAGEVVVDVRITDEMMPGVVSLPHGYGHDRDGVRLAYARSVPGVSINDLTDPDQVEPLSGNAVLNGVPVRVSASS